MASQGRVLDLLSLLVGKPLPLLTIWNNLVWSSIILNILRLHALKLSRNLKRQVGFPVEVTNYVGKPSACLSRAHKSTFFHWWRERSLISSKATVQPIANFFVFLHRHKVHMGLGIKGYRLALNHIFSMVGTNQSTMNRIIHILSMFLMIMLS